MRRKALLFAAAAALAATPALAPANAVPAATSGLALQGPAAPHALNVQYYAYQGYREYGYGPRYGVGLLDIPGEVIAGTVGVVGDVLEGPAYVAPYPSDGIAACEARFRSFDPATGTYTTYSGEQVLCPYLGG
jgi:hypothetical protein